MVTFLLPSGPKNLQPLFPGIDFKDVEEYYLQLKSGIETIATTNNFKRGCCCGADTVILFFVNYLGAVDSIPMKLKTEEVEVKSSRWKKPLQFPLQKWDGGYQRSEITSNEKRALENSCFSESDQDWLKELLATPNAWIQWKGIQGQNDDYLPVVVNDGRFITRKEEERYVYVLQLEVEFSNDNMTVRN